MTTTTTTTIAVSFSPLDFQDITPLPQDEGVLFPICCIDYEYEFIQAMNYMRAILQSHEYSIRALHLSQFCLQYNPANYTLWHFRRTCLAKMEENNNTVTEEEQETTDTVQHSQQRQPLVILNAEQILYEFKLASYLGGSKPKNYQIWYHRRMMLQSAIHLSSISSSSTTSSTSPTTKSTVPSWAKDELEYVAQVLQEDDKNYHVRKNVCVCVFCF